jgi:hypothetical protein
VELLLFVVVPLLLFAVLFPLPLLFFFPPPFVSELEEFDAELIDPVKKSVLPPAISIRDDSEFIRPTVFNTTSCAMFIEPVNPTISEHGEPSNCVKILLAHVSKVPFEKSCCVKLPIKP